MTQPKHNHNHNHVFIVGHPGAGKGLLAKKLAEQLGWEFVDADLDLEFKCGRTLKEIVGEQGADTFHQCQLELVTRLLQKDNIIVATDANIIGSTQLMKLLSKAYVVYLQASTSIQIERTSRQPRPLLLNTGLNTFLDNLHADRDELYAQAANLIINSDDNQLEKHVTIISEMLNISMKAGENKEVISEKELTLFHRQSHDPVYLSNKQALCLKLMAQGKTSKEMAKEMNISFRTVEGHIAKMVELLGCSSSKELLSLYFGK